MRTDLKIGVIVGLLLVAAVIFFLVGNDAESVDSSETVGVVDMSGQGETELAPVEIPSPPVVEPPAPPQAPEPLTPPAPPVPVAPDPPVAPEPVPVELEPEPEPTPQVVVPEPAADAREPRYYTVKAGDSLTQIAEMWYGSGKHWKVIQEANKSLITNPDNLRVGWRLRIPYPEEIAKQP